MEFTRFARTDNFVIRQYRLGASQGALTLKVKVKNLATLKVIEMRAGLDSGVQMYFPRF